jgi:NADH-quinone oxidoreductase subunit F
VVRPPSPLRVEDLPLPRLKRELRAAGSATALDVPRIARELALPAAEVRGLVSWYAELHEDPRALRVCRGTSCTLAGARALHEQLAQEQTCRAVQCLGACDRSPAVLTAEDELIVGAGARALARTTNEPSPRSAVRSSIEPPRVVARLRVEGAHRLERARALGAWAGLERALASSPRALLDEIQGSGERGRGGAAFSTGAKWQACAAASGERKFVIANGDEGDPGSFVDRALLEDDPHGVLEGLALAAYAVGAREGLVFVRAEYPLAQRRIAEAIAEARAAGWLGENVRGSAFSFDVQLFAGMGSYVCGEETALLNAIEGRRGEVRLRPPYPVTHGLFGCPTVVNNVETLVAAAEIARDGAASYRSIGTAASPGTKALCLNHGFAQPGIVEVPFGISLREVVERIGGGGREGRAIRWLWVGGPMGSLMTPEEWDLPVCPAAMQQRGFVLGHGGIVAILEGDDVRELLERTLAFFAEESCGKCVPCSLGSARARDLGAALSQRGDAAERELAQTLRIAQRASLCAFGRLMPGPLLRLLELAPAELRGGAR